MKKFRKPRFFKTKTLVFPDMIDDEGNPLELEVRAYRPIDSKIVQRFIDVQDEFDKAKEETIKLGKLVIDERAKLGETNFQEYIDEAAKEVAELEEENESKMKDLNKQERKAKIKNNEARIEYLSERIYESQRLNDLKIDKPTKKQQEEILKNIKNYTSEIEESNEPLKELTKEFQELAIILASRMLKRLWYPETRELDADELDAFEGDPEDEDEFEMDGQMALKIAWVMIGLGFDSGSELQIRDDTEKKLKQIKKS